MQKLHKRLILAFASVLGIFALAAAPVWAEQGTSADSSGSSTGSSSKHSQTEAEVHKSTSTTAGSSGGAETEANDATDDNGTDSAAALHQKAQAMLQTKRANVKAHTAAQKQKACEAHKAEINKRATNYATAAQRHLDVFNKIFTRVQAFQTTKQLNVSNYDDLVAAATAKQTAAQTAVDNLKALDVSIDCTQTDPAATVATLKTTTANARAALQSYRQAIKDVVVALKGASTAQTDKSTTTDNSSTTDTSNTTGGTQ